MTKALSHKLPNKNRIFSLLESGYSVAQGLAITAEEESLRNPSLISTTNAMCVVGDLFMGVRNARNDPYQFPKIIIPSSSEKGAMFIGATEIVNGLVEVEVELPFVPKNNIIFGLFKNKSDAEDNYLLNCGFDAHRINGTNVLTKKAKVLIKFESSSFVNIQLLIQAKKKGQDLKLDLGSFDIDGADVTTGNKFIGVDFGNSNSYIVEYISAKSAKEIFEYPTFDLSQNVRSKLKKIDQKFLEIKNNGFLSKEIISEYAQKHIMSAVYHSNRIEMNPLSYGQTKKIIDEQKEPVLKDEIEVKNLATCYEWIIENHDFVLESPIQYIKCIHQMLMENIIVDNGAYRTIEVEIEGADFVPPNVLLISEMMGKLSDEIKSGLGDRSFIEFATTIHTKFVYIHPFIDGNGRTARLIFDSLLLNFNCPPIIIKSDEKPRYISSLKKSNDGSISELVDLYADSVVSLLDEIEKSAIHLSIRNDVDNSNIDYSEIDASDDPFDFIINSLAERNILDKLENFDAFFYECEQFRSALNEVIDNSDQEKLSDAGVSIHYEQLGSMSEQTYREVIQAKSNKPIWYFSITINFNYSQSLTYLFAFKFDNNSESDISLVLGKASENFYELRSEPIRLRKLIYKNNQLIMIDNLGKEKKENYMTIMKKLLAEVIKFYVME